MFMICPFPANIPVHDLSLCLFLLVVHVLHTPHGVTVDIFREKQVHELQGGVKCVAKEIVPQQLIVFVPVYGNIKPNQQFSI